MIYHNQVRWLSRAKVLKRFYNLNEEIGIFMIEKENLITELKENWLWDFAFLTDISDHLNFLNLKLQEQGKLIFQLNDITAFEMKLKLFIKQIREGNFC